MEIVAVNPDSLGAPKGYSNGILVKGACDLLFVAGQIGWDTQQRLVSSVFVEQFRQALRNVVAVVRAAGGEPAHVVRVTAYVTDKREYLSDLQAVGAAWRDVMGRHYPAMALVQVSDLLEDGAKVELEATAAIPRGESA